MPTFEGFAGYDQSKFHFWDDASDDFLKDAERRLTFDWFAIGVDHRYILSQREYIHRLVAERLAAKYRERDDIRREASLSAPVSQEGAGIPILYGKFPVPTQVIHATTPEVSEDDPPVTTMIVTYGICEGEIGGIHTVFGNDKALYDPGAGGVQAGSGATTVGGGTGSETQTPYRGTAYTAVEYATTAESGRKPADVYVVGTPDEVTETTTTTTTTTVTTTGVQVDSLEHGYSTTFGIVADTGAVYACGLNDRGQLGLGDTTNRASPVLIASFTGVTQIAASYWTTAFLKSDGTVWVCGEVGKGGAGDGDTSANRQFHAPTQVPGLTGIVRIAITRSDAGLYEWAAIYAVKSDGTAWAWGWNLDNYRLGLGASAHDDYYPDPTQIAGIGGSGTLAGVTDIKSGYNHVLARLSSGRVVSWGEATEGQSGQGKEDDFGGYPNGSWTDQDYVVTDAAGTLLENVRAIHSFFNRSYAITTDNKLYGWGRGNRWEFGVDPSGYGGTISDQIDYALLIDTGVDGEVTAGYDWTIWRKGQNLYGAGEFNTSDATPGTPFGESPPDTYHEEHGIAALTISGLSGTIAAIIGNAWNLWAVTTAQAAYAQGSDTDGCHGDG